MLMVYLRQIYYNSLYIRLQDQRLYINANNTRSFRNEIVFCLYLKVSTRTYIIYIILKKNKVKDLD